MKKVFKAFIVTSIITALSGCTQIRGKGNSSKASWIFDERNHWHACTDEGCEDIKKDVAEHTFNDEVVSPTFEEKGYTLHTCETCGYQYKDNATDVLEHNYSSEWSFDERTHWHACTDKGYASLKKDEDEHILGDEWIIDEEPTATKQGKKHNQCTVCGRLVEEAIDKIPDEAVNDSNLTFIQLESGNYSVKAKYTSLNEIIIPDTYKGKAVTKIENSAFRECQSLTSITIPNSVTSIGDAAFGYCSSLTSITIPSSVTSIGNYAFSYCESLTSASIPNSITNIGLATFGDCSSLTSITLPNSVASIDEYAFGYCTSLTSITIPNSVTFIDKYAFYYCSSLETINFNGTAAQWNAMNKGFDWNGETPRTMAINCAEPDLTFTLLDSGSYSVKSASKSVEEVIIPSSYNGKPVSMIEEDAFYNCSSLTSIIIPNSVTSIGEHGFHNCVALTSIIIPNSVTSIGFRTFGYCKSLTSITIPNSVTSIGKYAFLNCSSLETINFAGTKEQWNAISKGEGWNDGTPTSMVITVRWVL